MRIPRIEAPLIPVKIQRNVSVADWCKKFDVPPVFHLNAYAVHGKFAEGIRLIKEGGDRVVAVALALDSGKELAEWLVKQGVAPQSTKFSNLTNGEIVQAGADQTFLFSSTMTFFHYKKEDEKDLLTRSQIFTNLVRGSVLECSVPCTLPHNFVVSLLHVGLVWNGKDANKKR